MLDFLPFLIILDIDRQHRGLLPEGIHEVLDAFICVCQVDVNHNFVDQNVPNWTAPLHTVPPLPHLLDKVLRFIFLHFVLFRVLIDFDLLLLIVDLIDFPFQLLSVLLLFVLQLELLNDGLHLFPDDNQNFQVLVEFVKFFKIFRVVQKQTNSIRTFRVLFLFNNRHLNLLNNYLLNLGFFFTAFAGGLGGLRLGLCLCGWLEFAIQFVFFEFPLGNHELLVVHLKGFAQHLTVEFRGYFIFYVLFPFVVGWVRIKSLFFCKSDQLVLENILLKGQGLLLKLF